MKRKPVDLPFYSNNFHIKIKPRIAIENAVLFCYKYEQFFSRSSLTQFRFKGNP